MCYYYRVPEWFLGFDVAFQFLIAIILFSMGAYAIRLFCNSHKCMTSLGYGFVSLGAAFLIEAVHKLSKLNSNVMELCQSVGVRVDLIGVFGFIVFASIGISLLTTACLKNKDKRLFWMLLALLLVPTFVNGMDLKLFYLISTIYLLFIAVTFLGHYLQSKSIRALTIAVAFVLFAVGWVEVLFSWSSPALYAVGHTSLLVGFLLILYNAYEIKRGK